MLLGDNGASLKGKVISLLAAAWLSSLSIRVTFTETSAYAPKVFREVLSQQRIALPRSKCSGTPQKLAAFMSAHPLATVAAPHVPVAEPQAGLPSPRATAEG